MRVARQPTGKSNRNLKRRPLHIEEISSIILKEILFHLDLSERLCPRGDLRIESPMSDRPVG
ncbi:hypothetical protein PROFUN_02894 [Planoprotostelium fungivorum]|uniref:Uncharacterized protein n=1 Tax=Planoprotostelium fungivorum TaxID=1890364 RepID=A0A2P6NS09_9EUKA|nr:hypothetical protein PROFUN_02894 [Planoprotostelium fungivorum]